MSALIGNDNTDPTQLDGNNTSTSRHAHVGTIARSDVTTTTTTTSRSMTSSAAVPVCTSAERLRYIRSRIAASRHDDHATMTSRSSPPPLELLASDDKRVAFCAVHKSASSTIKRLVVLATGKYSRSQLNKVVLWRGESLRRLGLRTVIDDGDDDDDTHQSTLRTIADYRKFVVIRNPIDRFVSAFNQKMIAHKNDRYVRRMQDWLRVNGSQQLQLSRGVDGQTTMTTTTTLFQQFTQAVLGGFSDAHWNPYADGRCHFGDVDYDDVIRLESFRHDFEPLAAKYLGLNWTLVLNASHNVKRNKLAMLPTTSTAVTPRHLPIFKQISRSERIQLKQMYRLDLDWLGYDFDVDSLTTSCLITTSDGSVCC